MASQFSKGMTLNFKLRGVAANLKQHAGQTVTVIRGGKNVTLSVPTSEFNYDTYEYVTTTIKVPAVELAASIRKS